MGKVTDEEILLKLEAEKKLKVADFKTSLAISLSDTGKIWYLPYKDTDESTLRKLYNLPENSLQKICIRVIRIRGYEIVEGTPFFLIDKLWIE